VNRGDMYLPIERTRTRSTWGGVRRETRAKAEVASGREARARPDADLGKHEILELPL
jgi:hypothetical protein